MEQQSNVNTQIELELLKKEIADMKQIHVRLDTAIEKITDFSNCINRLLAVHEEKITQQEDAQQRSVQEFTADIKELHSRITTRWFYRTRIYYTKTTSLVLTHDVH